MDVVASGVVAAANNGHGECRTFNINNFHHDDGCSLNAFVNWIESAGYPITRSEDYEQWFACFEAKLKSLPEKQRQMSALEILGAYASPVQSSPLVPSSDNFQALIKSSILEGGLPHLDETYIHKFLQDVACRDETLAR